MKILTFRPFKRLKDQQLIEKIHKEFQELKSENKYYREKLMICDALIKEAKHRELYCSKEVLYKKILYK